MKRPDDGEAARQLVLSPSVVEKRRVDQLHVVAELTHASLQIHCHRNVWPLLLSARSRAVVGEMNDVRVHVFAQVVEWTGGRVGRLPLRAGEVVAREDIVGFLVFSAKESGEAPARVPGMTRGERTSRRSRCPPAPATERCRRASSAHSGRARTLPSVARQNAWPMSGRLRRAGGERKHDRPLSDDVGESGAEARSLRERTWSYFPLLLVGAASPVAKAPMLARTRSTIVCPLENP
jgi:hypothetical protein